jgi:uncharacterized repeat protein (TIGR03803 family)
MSFGKAGHGTKALAGTAFLPTKRKSRGGNMKPRRWTLAVSCLSVLAVTTVFALALSAKAQTYNVIYNFTGGQDGGQPEAGLTIDQAGRLYGTTRLGGNTGGNCGGNGCGTVFRLETQGSGWIFTPLYDFQGGADGSSPQARVIFGPDGSLYGTTAAGGINGGGTVFRLRPPAIVCRTAFCPWTETVLYSFGGSQDGATPEAEVVFDQAGNMYGTTYGGGVSGTGAVYELMPSGGGWTESVLYSFAGGNDGANPSSAVVLDQSGNLYGTTIVGGEWHVGTVYQLTPSAGGWQEKVLQQFLFSSTGAYPQGGLTLSSSGQELYGTTSRGELLHGYYGGTVYVLRRSGGGWQFSTQCSELGPPDTIGSRASLTFGPDGYLYGTTYKYRRGNGSVSRSCDSVYDFAGGVDGANPVSNVVFDSNGHMYGTTLNGGANGDGLVWEITP